VRPLEEWIGKSLIRQTLATHSRGVDRADAELLKSAYHPDATVDYGFFVGEAQKLAAILAAAQKTQPVTLHRTSNMWIKVRDGHARSESYVIAYAEHRGGDEAVQRLIGGRYLDQHERRGGEWRLTHRRYVLDFNMNHESTAACADPSVALAHFAPRGGHGASDPGRALLAQHAAGFDHRGAHTVPNISDAEIDAALSRDALHEINMAYARAADRADADLMGSIFHEDSTVVSGLFNGNGKDYALEITRFVRESLERCFHSIANEWYEVKGDAAVGETYVIANMTAGGHDTLTGGRYIDSYERRQGVWKIKTRTFVADFARAEPSSHETGGLYASLTTRGSFGPADPVYAFWNQL
jgi:hypothetical protein